ncbi:hypothetical protein SAMN02745166_03716 [Prosthecobacter debontii]|uniref:Uncharacterized protein n=1 Tax=Prosthecobacter debontii TaxID=48467 RepID=A0A1T4YME7_9BACT|nr:hypothetical protein [Prosthecobacter debontii]SKB02932.1 hypothetical protein SAMN02745166_03716 [Prosthecobacter debontii]
MKRLILTYGLVGGLAWSLQAQDGEDVAPEAPAPAITETVPGEEATIPQAYGDNRYEATWKSNPFLRKTVVIAGPKVDWSADWALAGMYRSTTGKVTVSLQNKQTGEFKRVTSDAKPEDEFRIVKANFNRNRNEASVDIARGSETATLKYDDNLSSKPVTVANTFKAPTGQPGTPNAAGRPGQPVNATPPGAVPNAGMPGAANTPAAVNRPNITPGPVGQPPTAAPPTISRRRQLIPAPVTPPPAQQ